MKPPSFFLIPVAATAALLLAGCGTQHAYSAAGATPSVSQTTTEIALTPQWAAEGQRLRQFKKDELAKLPPGAPTPGDAADFAYRSLPVDITGDGTYTLYFGPVDASFDWPRSPESVTYEFPSDAHFMILPGAGEIGMATVNGQRYLKVVVSVSGFTAPYSQFTGWIY